MEPIGKISNARATLIRKLHQKKHRDDLGLFMAEGNRAVEQILQNRVVDVDFLVVKAGSEWRPPRAENEPGTRLATGRKKTGRKVDGSAENVTATGKSAIAAPEADANAANTANTANTDIDRTPMPVQPTIPEVLEADPKLFGELAATGSPQDVLAVCRIPEPSSAADLLTGEGVVLALYQLGDPGNLGTILRTAVWFGVRGLFMSTGTVDLYNPKVVRSMAGSAGAIPVASGYLAIFLEEAKKEGWRVYLLDSGAGSKELSSIRPGRKSVLVLGSEAHGLPDSILDAYERIRIEPQPGGAAVESLNAAIAASIAMYRLASVRK